MKIILILSAFIIIIFCLVFFSLSIISMLSSSYSRANCQDSPNNMLTLVLSKKKKKKEEKWWRGRNPILDSRTTKHLISLLRFVFSPRIDLMSVSLLSRTNLIMIEQTSYDLRTSYSMIIVKQLIVQIEFESIYLFIILFACF